jgi:hypothetical protein
VHNYTTRSMGVGRKTVLLYTDQDGAVMVRLDFAGSFCGRELDVLRPKVVAALEFFPEIATRNALKIGRIRPGGGARIAGVSPGKSPHEH